jgi:hypothetical protein
MRILRAKSFNCHRNGIEKVWSPYARAASDFSSNVITWIGWTKLRIVLALTHRISVLSRQEQRSEEDALRRYGSSLKLGL